MDASILTTFFCFILLVINLLLFTQLRDLTKQVHHYVDRSDLHSEKLRTIMSILQQVEAKQDLMFNNAPPVPGELPSERAEEETFVPFGTSGVLCYQNVSPTVPTHKPEGVLRAVLKAKEDFEANRPYAKSKKADAVIALPAPTRRKPGPKPGTTKGIKRGPYKPRKIT